MARDALHDKEGFQVVGGYISPVSDYYHKSGLIESTHRIAMCQLAVDDSEWISVDEFESQQENYSRTIQVLDAIQARIDSIVQGPRVVLLAGADLIKSFGTPGLWAAEDVLFPSKIFTIMFI